MSRIYIFSIFVYGCAKGDQHIAPKTKVICVYDEVPISYFKYVVDTFLNRELYNESPHRHIIVCVQEDRLGDTANGLWATSSAHERIQPSTRGEVRLVPREQSQGAETEQTS